MSASANGIPIILHHTDDATHTPDPLYAGETAVCVAPTQTKLWVGEGPPSNVNRLLLSTDPLDTPLFGAAGGGIPEPTAAGNWLRSNVATWVAGLPLSGGTVANAAGTVLTVSATSAATGQAMFIDNRTRPVGLLMDQYGGTAAIQLNTNADGLYVRNQAATSRGVAIQFTTAASSTSATAVGVFVGGAAASAAALEVQRYTPSTTSVWRVFGDGSTLQYYDGTGDMILLRNMDLTATANYIRTFTNTFIVNAAGAVSTTGLTLAGQPVTLGDPDSGGTGYRCLRVPN